MVRAGQNITGVLLDPAGPIVFVFRRRAGSGLVGIRRGHLCSIYDYYLKAIRRIAMTLNMGAAGYLKES